MGGGGLLSGQHEQETTVVHGPSHHSPAPSRAPRCLSPRSPTIYASRTTQRRLPSVAGHLANDVKAVLDVCGVQRTALVGHSIGGFSVTRMLLEAPERVTCAVMSSTFYGIADPGVTRYIEAGPMGSAERAQVACDLKKLLPAGSAAAARQSFGAAEGRPFDRPDNFSDGFRAAQAALSWLYDSMNDTNTQVTSLALKSRFRLVQETGGVTPAALRRAFRGPLLFTVTECDSAVHWEVVEYVASLFDACDEGAKDLTAVHCFHGRLRHAPNIEDPGQYNATLLAFLTRAVAGESLHGVGDC